MRIVDKLEKHKEIVTEQKFMGVTSLLRRHLMDHLLYNFFACKQILPANLKVMPAEEARHCSTMSDLGGVIVAR
jgi:hypothetical protein